MGRFCRPIDRRSQTLIQKTLVLLVLVLAASPAAAQSTALDRLTPALPTAGERKAADIASYVLPAVLVALDTRIAWRSEDRKRALQLEAFRLSATYGVVFLVKELAHRSRPCAPACGIDDPSSSLPSGHTALAFSTLGGPRLAFALTLDVGTAGLRIGAAKHWLTDTMLGAAVGAAASRIR